METFLYWGSLVSLALAALWIAFRSRVEVRVVRKYERHTTVLAGKSALRH